ncbi:unnamed protein product [Trichobilharzia regenti]|nr:unnamed protein product [Trichobilharzia regenti]
MTTHRLLWFDPLRPDSSSFIALPLAAIISVKLEEGGGLTINRTPKLILRLISVPALQNALISLSNPPKWIEHWCDNVGVGGGGNTGGENAVVNYNYTTAAVVSYSKEDHVKLGFPRAGHHEFLRGLNEVLKVGVMYVMKAKFNFY